MTIDDHVRSVFLSVELYDLESDKPEVVTVEVVPTDAKDSVFCTQFFSGHDFNSHMRFDMYWGHKIFRRRIQSGRPYFLREGTLFVSIHADGEQNKTTTATEQIDMFKAYKELSLGSLHSHLVQAVYDHDLSGRDVSLYEAEAFATPEAPNSKAQDWTHSILKC